jgi:CHAD domain-containing protein
MAGSIDGISKGVDTVCRELRGAARRLEKIPLSGLKKSDLRVGTKLTLKRARKDYRMACERSEPELFHDWRKHVKYAYYHTALMGHLMPDHAQRYALGLGELAAELGCSQDLVVLERLLVAQPDSLGIDLHLQRMRRLVRDAQGESRRRARLLGRQLFGGGHPPSAKILSFAAAPTGS